MDMDGAPIPGPAENKDFPPDVSPTDASCNKWKDDLDSSYLVSPVDPKDPAVAWFYTEK